MKDSKKWFRGDAGQLRLAVPKFKLDREGIHAATGAVMSILPWVAFYLVGHEAAALAAFGYAVLVTLFVLYERWESDRINDWAWRDVGGFLWGATGAHIGGVLWGVLGG